MTKQQYLDSLEECEEISEIEGIKELAKNDLDLLLEELEEILEDADEYIHEIRIAPMEAEQERYMYGEPTDDELGLTQM